MRGQNDLQVQPSKDASFNPSLPVYPPKRVIRVVGEVTGTSCFFCFELGTGAHPQILSEPDPRNSTSLANCQEWMELGHDPQPFQGKSVRSLQSCLIET
jgi:hypothetical protein